MSTVPMPAWEKLHREAEIVDWHAHPSLKISLFKRSLTSRFRASRSFDPFSVRTDFGKLQEGCVDVLLSTVYAPEKGIVQDCPYLRALRFVMPGTWRKVFSRPHFEVTLEMMDALEKAVGSSPAVEMVKSVSELDAILDQKGARPIAVIHNIEGAHSLDGKLENLDRLFERGIAYLTLAHFYGNEAVDPTYPYPESVQVLGCFQGHRDLSKGLTPFGEQLVEKMIELGIILDISHCTPPARERVYEIVGKRLPIIASHVGAYEINPSPYNLKDWEIVKIAESGGLSAVIFMNYWLMPHETKRGLNFIARTIQHFVDVGGIDAVGIGTDFDGFTDPPDDLKDASQLGRLTQRLIAEGYREDAIKKIWGGNGLRVLRQGWGRK